MQICLTATMSMTLIIDQICFLSRMLPMKWLLSVKMLLDHDVKFFF
jgi:hypothetical protein